MAKSYNSIPLKMLAIFFRDLAAEELADVIDVFLKKPRPDKLC